MTEIMREIYGKAFHNPWGATLLAVRYGMNMENQSISVLPSAVRAPRAASGPPRSNFGNRFVYAVISQRAHGLSIGVNLNPDKFCNFNCVYCEVDHETIPIDTQIDLDVLAAELEDVLARAHSDGMRELPGYEAVPDDLLKLKEVALSGDGEPTLCPMFAKVVETVVHVRAKAFSPFSNWCLLLIRRGFI